jgi:trk system potassium uptake protein TrkH
MRIARRGGVGYILPTMRKDAARSPSVEPAWPPHLLVLAALLGVAATLARGATGAPLIPALIALALQLPALALWLNRRCGLLQRGGEGGDDRATTLNLTLTAVVFLIAGGAAAAARRMDLATAILTFFVAGMVGLEAASAWIARLATLVGGGWRIARAAAGGWVVIILLGTTILAAPLSQVRPDYTHNFWRHVSFCGQTAASAACLVGSTGYSLAEEYSAFGCGVVYVLMQLGAAGVAALAVAAMRAITARPIEPGRVVALALVVQLAGAVALMPAWTQTDAPDLSTRAGWGLFHAAAALFNCGFALRPDGLATYLTSGVVFVVTSALAIVGSIGLPTFLAALAMLRRPNEGEVDRAAPAPFERLVNWEFGAAFWLLVVGAIVLFLCESGELIPAALRPERPVDIGANQVAMNDLPASARWRSAVFLAISARSAGFVGVPVIQGGLNWVSFGVLCAWMMIGGAAASFAGGVRTTTLMGLFVLLLLRAPHGLDDASRQRIIRLLVGLCVLMATLTVATVLLLAALQSATPWELVLDGVAAANGVGWSSGLAPHLTWPARCLIILAMLAGRLLPLVWWCRIAAFAASIDSPPTAREARRRK